MKNYKIIGIEYWSSIKEKRIKRYAIKKKYWLGWFYIRLGLDILLFYSQENAQKYIDNEIQRKIKPIINENLD